MFDDTELLIHCASHERAGLIKEYIKEGKIVSQANLVNNL
jgi:hypothetical protein